jgi:hypothetical protein
VDLIKEPPPHSPHIVLQVPLFEKVIRPRLGRAGEIKTRTLQVGIKIAWPLLGLVGFQKSEQLHATGRGLFSFLTHA